MKNYFVVSTTVANAIDNITIYGMSDLEKIDVVRLISAHHKYPYSLEFINKDDVPDIYCAHPLNRFLEVFEGIVLHSVSKVYTDIIDGWDEIKVDGQSVEDSDGYKHIDLSYGDFKSVSKSRTAMLKENRCVGEVMSFLFEHNIEFEYDGSRAKLKCPNSNPSNKYFKAYMEYAAFSRPKVVLKYAKHHTSVGISAEEIPFIY